MSAAEFGGIIRTGVAFGLGFLVNKGMIDGETATAIAGALATLAVAAWSIRSKRRASA